MGSKDKAFVVGDVHGMINELNQILEEWRPEEEQLIFVGDYVDRGEDSKATLLKVRGLQQEHDAILMRGNHEQMMLNFLEHPRREWTLYYMNGGHTTVGHLLEENPADLSPTNGYPYARRIKQTYPWLKQWLNELRYYYEFGDFIIVHAGVNLNKKDWHDSSLNDFIWIRDPFLNGKNNTGKQIIFGHTPTITLQSQGGIWQQDNKTDIDGGAVYGGSLIALRIDQTDIVDIITVESGRE